MRKNAAVPVRGRGRNVEVSTATESANKLMKYGRQSLPKERKVTPAEALAEGVRLLYPKLAGEVAAFLIGSTEPAEVATV